MDTSSTLVYVNASIFKITFSNYKNNTFIIENFENTEKLYKEI